MRKTIRRRFNGKASPLQDELNKRLAKAATEGNADEVGALLKQGADVNARAEYGLMTPLHWAAWRGRTDVAVALIERGADVRAKDAEGWTPLRLAVWRGYADTAGAIFGGLGADWKAKDAEGGQVRKGKAGIGSKRLRLGLLRHARKVKAARLGKRWGP